MSIKEKLEIIIEATDNASSKLQGIVGVLGKGGAVAAATIAGAALSAATAVGGVTAAVLATSKEAAGLIPIRDSFNAIAEASGKSAGSVIDALRKQSNYMITDIDLMKSYTLASQLVGDEFANQLPDAMGYLGKVSAATGESMDSMLSSLVKGVGRLSPMILDNLGVQVSLNDAYDAYAASIGKSADELTKQEQQTALMNQVLEKLHENTANMAEASDPFAKIATTFENLKTTVTMSVGEAVLPLITQLADSLAQFVESDEFQSWLQALVDGFSQFMTGLADYLKSDEFQNWLSQVATFVKETLVPTIAAFVEFVKDPLTPTMLAISKYVTENIIPAIKALADWFSVNLTPKIEALVELFQNTLGKALTNLRNAWNTNFLGIRDYVDGFLEHIKLVIALVKNIFEGNWREVGAILRKMVENFIDTIKKVDWLGLGKLIIQGIGNGIKAMGTWLWDTLVNVVKNAVDAVKGFLNIESPSRLMADQVGKQMALGLGKGLEAGIKDVTRSVGGIMQPLLGGLQTQAVSGMAAGGGVMLSTAAGGMQTAGGTVVVNYQPMISFADEFELERRLKPIIQRVSTRK